MEETKEIAKGSHYDGDPAAEINQRVKLAEMPIEILEHILVHLDDKSLLRASHVCTLFASVVETAFAQKYFNECYEVSQWSDDEMSFHEVMLSKYGDKIRKIKINVDEEDERLLDLAERTCCNLSSLALYQTPKMILLTGLKEVYLANLDHLNRASFIELIHQNQQLEILVLSDQQVDLLDVLDGLKHLKTLKYTNYSNEAYDFPIIRLNALESLKLYLPDTEKYKSVLRAITCKELKSLTVFGGGFFDLDDIDINRICSFGTLESLQLYSYKVTEDRLRALGRRLPHISEFGMGIAENVDHTIQLALRSFPKLTKFTIGLKNDIHRELSGDFKRSIHDFHARFAVTNTEIKMVHDQGKISISKDRIFAFDDDTNDDDALDGKSQREKPAENAGWSYRNVH